MVQDPIRSQEGHFAAGAAVDAALAVIRFVHEPLVVLDDECRIRIANDGFCRLVQATVPETQDRHIWETCLGSPGEPAARQELEAACRDARSIANLELRRVLPNLGERVLVLNGEAIHPDDRSSLLLLSVQDVTDSQEVVSLRVDRENLRVVNRRKDEALGTLAHELRSPLQSMHLGLAALRAHTDDPEASARAREVLDRQIDHLVRIVDDLFDMTRITQGKVVIRRMALKLEDVVAAAVEFCRPALEAAKHSLAVDVPDHSVVMQGDPVRLTQVIVNLLNNAIKFTPPGGRVWVSAEVMHEHDRLKPFVQIRVRDTGLGIVPEMKQKIFDMFVQGDRGRERAFGGLGVGLNLVQELVTLHGGSVEVSSDGAGRGSEFTVQLPIDPIEDDAHGEPTAASNLARPIDEHRTSSDGDVVKR